MQHTDAGDFASELRETCLGTRIGRLQRYAARTFDQRLRELDTSMPQLEILSLLVLRDAPVRPSEIARLLIAERSTVSRNLASLQQRGLIAASETSPTGRSMSVCVTPAGRLALADARGAWSEAQQTLTDALGPGAQAVLDDWLGRLTTGDGPTP